MQPSVHQTSAPEPVVQWSTASEVDIKMYARIILQWWWLVALCTLVGALSAYAVSSFSVPIYQASTTLLVNEARNSTASYQDLIASERVASTYSQLIKRPSTLAAVAREFNVAPEILSDAVTAVNVSPVRDTQLINVTIEGTSPELVAAVADTLPQVFINEIKQVQESRFADSKTNLQQRIQELNDQIEQKQALISNIGDSYTAEQGVELNRLRNQMTQLQSSYNSLLQSLETLNLTAAQSRDNITIAEPPAIPTAPIRPRTLVNTLLAAIVGAMLSLGIIFLVEYLDDRVRTPGDLSRIVDTSVLSSISVLPNSHKNSWRSKGSSETAPLITISEPRHPISEAYRTLRSNLQFASVDTELNSILVTSATESEGKTTTAANLGIVMAQSGKRVILIDCDLRKPRLNRVMKVPANPGTTEALWMENQQISAYLRETEVKGLRVLASGKIPPNPADLLGSQRMQRLIESLKKEADLIVFDAPPILAVTDAAVLSQLVQGVLLVIDTSKTTRSSVSRAVESLAYANANLFGVVFNRMTRNARSYGYYYADNYGGYYGEDGETNELPKTPATSGVTHESSAGIYRNGNASGKSSPQPIANG